MNKTEKISDDVNNCSNGCSHFKLGNLSSDGTWDSMVDWICHHPELSEEKIIQSKVGLVE